MGIDKIIQDAARGLRKEPTPVEKILWEYLRTKKFCGYKFKRQQPIDRFIADFVCFEKRLIIELDGEVHLSQKERDNERDNYLKESGFRVIRFPNDEVEQDIEGVLSRLKHELDGATPTGLPSKWVKQ